ncbi:helix-turn-helix domain-containing protein [Streptomyces sp. SID14478]|uniref:helix-turn-helix domain-containing protein n=1 Tax=Streptomyces sp. SID14478 TaxID=2706073 RepID=UPI0013E0E15D|nr:Scr1 family TA system antitoxin-like transcriptional regulator [Streptomyces sp. SID14478]NEB80095.1 helix-turn-helix domain-containing protein [Streptomyces sp. SID14478]
MANGPRQAARKFFGLELRRRREDAGLTQVELGLRVFVSGGDIGQFEQAIRKPQLDVAQRIDDVLQSDGIFERTWRKLIADHRYADYFAEVAELERLASRICEFAPTVVPGLLRTASYAEAATVAAHPFVGGSSTTIGQLEHIVERGVRGAPPIAYTETAFSGTLLDDPAAVKRAQRADDLLRVAALSPEASLALVESAVEDYRRCASTS